MASSLEHPLRDETPLGTQPSFIDGGEGGGGALNDDGTVKRSAPGVTVVIAIDGSKQADQAFAC